MLFTSQCLVLKITAWPLSKLASAAGLRPALNLVPVGGSLAPLGLYIRFACIPYPRTDTVYICMNRLNAFNKGGDVKPASHTNARTESFQIEPVHYT